jgi:excisionase family DNA binding protein
MMEFLKAYEIGSQLGLSTGRIYQMARAGELPCIRVGRLMKFPRQAWEEWLDEQNAAAREQMSKSEPITSNMVDAS